jgi:hypothetical protein
MREQKWEEFNNSDFVIQEELKKIRGRSSAFGSVADSLNTSAEFARLAGSSSFASSSSNGDEPREYSLTLKVNYETQWGQEIAILGNIPQFGNWDINKAYKMKWTPGHVWVAENIKIDETRGDKTYFMYKYVVLFNGHFQSYERGLDRIADIKLLNGEFNNYI